MDPNTPETPHFHSPKYAAASALLLQMIQPSENSPRHALCLLSPEIEISGCFFTVHLLYQMKIKCRAEVIVSIPQLCQVYYVLES